MIPLSTPIEPSNCADFRITGSALDEVNAISNRPGHSITEVVRLALSLLRVIIDEREDGPRLIVTETNGLPIKEIIIPDSQGK